MASEPSFDFVAPLQPGGLTLLSQAFTVTATSGIVINNSASGPYTIVAAADQNCYVIFGNAFVSTPTAANSVYFPANRLTRIKIPNGCTHLRLLRATADGIFTWFVSV